jgi:hypothetical protein
MKNEVSEAPDSVDIRLEGTTEAALETTGHSTAVASREPSAPPHHNGIQQSEDVAVEVNSHDQRNDSEAETVVDEDATSGNANPKSIKHEGKSVLEVKSSQEGLLQKSQNGLEAGEKELDRRKANRDYNAHDANSSNLSTPASSPARDRSSSKATSEPGSTQQTQSREKESHSKDGISRKRKLKVDESDDKGQHRRRKRATSSEATNSSDRREVKTINKERSESPPARSRHRAQSTQSLDPQGITKRRKPPPLQVGQRRKPSEDAYEQSDDSGSANGNNPQLRKLISAESHAMSPAKGPHKKLRDRSGRTFLARACAAGDLETARQRLQERPEDLNVDDYAGNTPLQIASLEGEDEIVKMLLDAGCDTTCKNVDGDTPLIDAVENGHLEVVKMLLAVGLDPCIGNAKGEGPLDLLNPEKQFFEEIKAALEEAKGQYTGHRFAEDHHGQKVTGKDGLSIHSPRASPSLHITRSPPPHGLAPRRAARAEATRNDLLWVNPTLDELRKRAESGDTLAVNHILSMKPISDIEAVLLAAKGGHDSCLSLLLALGQPEEDPEPLSQYEPEYATPMLTAIGRSNTLQIIVTLLSQSGFNPTRRLYKNLTYYELAEERQGPNWQAEYAKLKEAYDSYKVNKPKNNSPSKVRSTTLQREGKPRKREALSPSHHSIKRQSPERQHSHHQREGLKKRLSHDGNRNRLHTSKKEDSRESSVAVSDREVTPHVRTTEKKRSFSDACVSNPNDRDNSKPKKKLISSKALREDKERRRRVSPTSSSSSQEHIRSNLSQARKSSLVGPVVGRREVKDEEKSPPPESVKKRPFQSMSPSNGNTPGFRRGSDVLKKTKRPRMGSIGTDIDRERLPPPRPLIRSQTPPIPVKSPSPTFPSHAAPVAFMGGTSSNPPSKKRFNSIDHRLSTDSAANDIHSIAVVRKGSADLSFEDGSSDGKQTSTKGNDQKTSTAIIKTEIEDPAEVQEKQVREREFAEQRAKEKAAKEERERIAREAEEARLEEQRRAEEAERVARLEREAEERAIQQKRQEEETQLRLIERERQRKEEQERRRAEQEERERILIIQRQEEEERRRRDGLPNALRIAADLSPEEAKHPSEIAKWLPLYTAFGWQLDPDCDEQAREERWITNIQVAPILAIDDLSLSQCKHCSVRFYLSTWGALLTCV